MKKEILTIEKIKHDLYFNLKSKMQDRISRYAVMTFLLALLGLTLYYQTESIVIVFILSIFPIAFAIILIFLFGRTKHRIDKNSFLIVHDKVSYTGRDTRYSKYPPQDLSPYYLYFPCYGKYTVPYFNYTWSDLYSMSYEGVYNTSIAEDEFYLIVFRTKKEKIEVVYNQKMFELKK